MNDTGDNALVLSYRIVYAILGSHVAARLTPCNPMRHAIILGYSAHSGPGDEWHLPNIGRHLHTGPMTRSAVLRIEHYSAQIEALRDVGRHFYGRGWSVGTSSNYSVVLGRAPMRLLITASGRDKGRLAAGDFTVVDGDGQQVDSASPKPSAETLVHATLARRSDVAAVLHTHSVPATVLSDAHFGSAAVEIAGYEMLKGLAGVTTHDTRVRIPILDNTQDMPALARTVAAEFGEGAPGTAFLVRGHGLYTWGRDLDEARRHVEILEFLFEVLIARGRYAATLN
jgi:methylthioribulose-1-phosphate dehydratase